MSTSALNASSVPVPEGFQIIANGFIPEMGPTTGYHNQTLLLAIRLIVLIVVLELRKRTAQRKHQMDVTPLSVSILKLVLTAAAVLSFGLLLASYKGVPVVGLILGVLVAIYTFVTRKTVFGRHIYSVGGNSSAAALSGVNTKRIDLMVMVNMGLLYWVSA